MINHFNLNKLFHYWQSRWGLVFTGKNIYPFGYQNINFHIFYDEIYHVTHHFVAFYVYKKVFGTKTNFSISCHVSEIWSFKDRKMSKSKKCVLGNFLIFSFFPKKMVKMSENWTFFRIFNYREGYKFRTWKMWQIDKEWMWPTFYNRSLFDIFNIKVSKHPGFGVKVLKSTVFPRNGSCNISNWYEIESKERIWCRFSILTIFSKFGFQKNLVFWFWNGQNEGFLRKYAF